MSATDDRRAELTRAMLKALELTWKVSDAKGDILDPTQRLDVLGGGCNAFLSGEFDPMGDGISLALAFLTHAREALILHGLELVIRPIEQQQEGQPS